MSDRWTYYFADGNVRRGPFDLEKLRDVPLQPETLVWRQGLPEWLPMREVPELWAIFAERFVASAAAPGVSPAVPPPLSSIQVPQTGFLTEAPPVPGGTLGYATYVGGSQANFSTGTGNKGMAIASMSLGIAGIVWWCLPGSALLGLPMSICALVFGIIASKQAKRGQAGGAPFALTGIIVAIANLALTLVLSVVFGWIIFAMSQTGQGRGTGAPSTGPTPWSPPPPVMPIPSGRPEVKLPEQPKFPTSLPTTQPVERQ